MSLAAYKPPDPVPWFLRAIKFICFPTEPHVKSGRNWFQELTDQDPEERIQRKESVKESGPITSDRELEIVVEAERLQIGWVPRGPVDKLMENIPSLGGFEQVLEEFSEFIKKWLPKMPPVNRFSFVGSASYLTKDVPDSYRVLNTLLKFVDLREGSRDLIYRINRPIKGSVVQINRLCTWTAAKYAGAQFKIGDQPATKMLSEETFVALEFDVNTHQDREPSFSGSEVLTGIQEVLAQVRHVVTKGDCEP